MSQPESITSLTEFLRGAEAARSGTLTGLVPTTGNLIALLRLVQARAREEAHIEQRERELESAAFEVVVETLRPKTPIPTPATVTNALRNAELRTVFMEQIGAFTSTEVARLAGNDARNPHALASRWRAQGRIFAVPWGEQSLFPAFQFTSDGAPHPAIAVVLRAFADRVSAWQTALWFVVPSPHLPDGQAPVALLDQPDELEAAVAADLDLPEF